MVDMGGNSPLHVACRRGSLACFSLLTQTRPGSGSNPGANQLAHIMATNNYSGKKRIDFFLNPSKVEC